MPTIDPYEVAATEGDFDGDDDVPEEARMIDIPTRTAPKRRQSEYLDVIRPCLAAMNAMPHVWASQNKVIKMPVKSHSGGEAWIEAGLGIGSADIVFSAVCRGVARIGWIECKHPGKAVKSGAGARRDAHQMRWAEAMRRKGHFVCHGVTCVDEAIAAVGRCEMGQER